jgi:hypothetical protein
MESPGDLGGSVYVARIATKPVLRYDKDAPYIPLWTKGVSVAMRDGLAVPGFTPYPRQQMWISDIKRTA